MRTAGNKGVAARARPHFSRERVPARLAKARKIRVCERVAADLCTVSGHSRAARMAVVWQPTPFAK